MNYGFGCGGKLPNIYVNLADPVVKDFIFKAIKAGDNYCPNDSEVEVINDDHNVDDDIFGSYDDIELDT